MQGLPKSTAPALDRPWLRVAMAAALGLAACAGIPGDGLRGPVAPHVNSAPVEPAPADMGPTVERLVGVLAELDPVPEQAADQAGAPDSDPGDPGLADRIAAGWQRIELAASWEIYQQRIGPFAEVAQWAGTGARKLARLVSLSPYAQDVIDLAHIDFAVLVADPVEGAESSGYGPRRDPINRRRKFHKGIDYRADRGTPVYSAGPGVVVQAGRHHGYGKLIVVDHGQGLTTRYAHLSKIEVAVGDFVAAGRQIGCVGATGRATGPHLHFEVRQNGEALNPYLALQLAAEANGDAGARITDVAPLASGLGSATVAGVGRAVQAFIAR